MDFEETGLQSKKSIPLIHRFDEAILGFPDASDLSIFKTPPIGEIADRFSIYATGYSVRSRESMEETYELLTKLIGEENWLELGAAYCEDYPSRNYNLNAVGDYFPEFLNSQGFSKWAQVASFEKLVMSCFHSKHTEKVFRPEQLASISESTRFVFQDSTLLFSSDYQIAKAWLDRNSDRVQLEEGKEFSVLFKLDELIHVKVISEVEYKLLSELKTKTLGAALEKCSDVKPEELSQMLLSWFQERLFVDFF